LGCASQLEAASGLPCKSRIFAEALSGFEAERRIVGMKTNPHAPRLSICRFQEKVPCWKARMPRIYVDRAIGRYCHYCPSGGNALTVVITRQGEGKASKLQ
jgi:hypothetical protein